MKPPVSTQEFAVIQIMACPPHEAMAAWAKKPYLFAVLDDGSNKNFCGFWNWIDKKWQPIEQIDR